LKLVELFKVMATPEVAEKVPKKDIDIAIRNYLGHIEVLEIIYGANKEVNECAPKGKFMHYRYVGSTNMPVMVAEIDERTVIVFTEKDSESIFKGNIEN
jgi:hypothetical protein